MHMISLAPNHRPFFVWCDTDATTFAPNLELRPFVFDFCCFHCSFQFCLAYQTSFESARRPPSCNPPDVCSRPVGRSIPVFLQTRVGLLSRLHCGQGRTKWACGTSGSERRGTIACRPWAIEKYSSISLPIRNATAWLQQFRCSDVSYGPRGQSIRSVLS